MNLMELKNTSETKKVKNKYKIDGEPFRMSQFEWRGTLNNGDLFVVIKYNMGSIKVKYAETEYELNNAKYVYVIRQLRFVKTLVGIDDININEIIRFLGWK